MDHITRMRVIQPDGASKDVELVRVCEPKHQHRKLPNSTVGELIALLITGFFFIAAVSGLIVAAVAIVSN